VAFARRKLAPCAHPLPNGEIKLHAAANALTPRIL
jgi:hypothetical protein